MKKFLAIVIVVVGLYAILGWAANNPSSIRKFDKKVDDTVEAAVDKGTRAVDELGK